MGRIIGEFNAAFSLALAAAAHCRLVTIRIVGDAQIDRAVEAKVRYIDRAWTAGSFDNDQRLYESHPRFSKIALGFGRVRSGLVSSRNCMISDFTNQYLALTLTKTGSQDFRLAVSVIDVPRSRDIISSCLTRPYFRQIHDNVFDNRGECCDSIQSIYSVRAPR